MPHTPKPPTLRSIYPIANHHPRKARACGRLCIPKVPFNTPTAMQPAKRRHIATLTKNAQVSVVSFIDTIMDWPRPKMHMLLLVKRYLELMLCFLPNNQYSWLQTVSHYRSCTPYPFIYLGIYHLNQITHRRLRGLARVAAGHVVDGFPLLSVNRTLINFFFFLHFQGRSLGDCCSACLNAAQIPHFSEKNTSSSTYEVNCVSNKGVHVQANTTCRPRDLFSTLRPRIIGRGRCI